MPRVSIAPEDALHFKGAYADGWGKITDAKSVVFQFPPDKETGRQDPPGLFCELTIQRYQDGDGNKGADQPEQVLLSIQRAGKDTGTLSLAHPGIYPDGDLSKEPEDAGTELGAEGNTLYAIQDGYQVNDKTKLMVFCKSLQEHGFKPEILKRTFFPDFVGLYAFFKTETLKKFREDQTSDPTAFVVTQIKEFPYEKKATATVKTKGAVRSPAAATALKPPAPPAPAIAPAAPPNGDASVEDIAAAILIQTLAPAKKGVVMPSLQKLKVEAFMAVSKHKPAVPAAIKKQVQEQLGDETWLAAVGEANSIFTISDDGQITFAA